MPQQTPKQIRVIDPILSTIVRGFNHPLNVLTEAIFPFVDVAKQGGTRIEFNKDDFKAVTTVRAPGTRVGEVQFGHAGVLYSLAAHALAAKVPQEYVTEAAGTPAADQMGRAAISVMRTMLLELEREQAALATDASSYAAANKITLAGGTQWSDPTSDMIGQMETAKNAVRAKIGQDPNTLVVPISARAAIKKHDQVTEAIKYTRFGVGTMSLLSEFFEVERVFVTGAVKADAAGAFSDVWGDFAWLGYVEASPSDMGNPSFGYTYRMTGHPSSTEVWWDRETKSWKTDVEFTRSAEIVGVDGGYLFSDLIA